MLSSRLKELLVIALIFLSGCANPVSFDEPQPADAHSCFLHATRICETPGCINHQLKRCDLQLSLSSAPLTEGIRTQMTTCLSAELEVTPELDINTAWRRCMHLLKVN